MLNPGTLALMIPIIALVIGAVSMLASHQRKMAEIIHRNNSSLPNGELEVIRQELQQMRMLMNQHTIALDDMRSKQNLPSSSATVQDRLGAS